MERLTEKCWGNLDPWEMRGLDHFCTRGCHDLGGCIRGCIVPRLYCRLAVYEDTGLTQEEITAVQELLLPIPFGRFHAIMEAERAGHLMILPPNEPLTLDQLREMDGDAVWVTPLDGRPPRWCFVEVPAKAGMGYVRNQTRKNGFVCDGVTGHFRTYSKTWVAYRRRPESDRDA